MSDSLWFHGVHHTRLPLSFTISQTVFHCLSLSSLSFTNSLSLCSRLCPLSQWHHLTISSSVTHFSYCPQSFPASGSFPMSQLFTSCGQSIGASASASVLPMNIQGWFPLGLTGLISLLSKGLTRVFSNTTVPKHQFFGDVQLCDPMDCSPPGFSVHQILQARILG